MLILIRGLPGSGKSTLARRMANSLAAHGRKTIWRENDMFVDYTKNPQQVDFIEAVMACTNNIQQWLAKKIDVAIVSNCFITRLSMVKYQQLAATYNHRVLIITCRGNYGSIHNVPQDVLDSMKANWQELQ